MSNFGNYYTEQQSDGTWICAAHFDNDVLVKGVSETAALRSMILALDDVNRVHCVQYMKNEPDLNAVKKARAVLAERKDIVEYAKMTVEKAPYGGGFSDELLVTLADALVVSDE